MSKFVYIRATPSKPLSTDNLRLKVIFWRLRYALKGLCEAEQVSRCQFAVCCRVFTRAGDAVGTHFVWHLNEALCQTLKGKLLLLLFMTTQQDPQMNGVLPASDRTDQCSAGGVLPPWWCPTEGVHSVGALTAVWLLRKRQWAVLTHDKLVLSYASMWL